MIPNRIVTPEPRSPLECSSHRPGPKKEQISTRGRTSFKSIIKNLRSDDGILLRSPQGVNKSSSHLPTKVPMAPKPSLQISDENILFANRKQLSRSTQNWFSDSVEQRNSLEGNVDEINSTQPPEYGQHSFSLRTSTPFMWRVNRRRSVDSRVNSALVGAPRLALSISMESSPNEMEDRVRPESRTQIQYSSIESISIDANIESDSEATEFDQLASISPPINCLQVAPVGEAVVFAPKRMSKRLTDASINQFRCRICLEEGDADGALLSPCRCKGTVGLVHHHCLRRWVLQSGKPQCELCGYAYILAPSKHRTSHSPPLQEHHHRNIFREWVSHQFTRRHLIIDILCLFMLTPSTVLGIHFCAIGATGFMEENPNGWQVASLWTLAVLLVLLWVIWTILAIRHHVSNYLAFRRHQNRRINAEAAKRSALPCRRFSIQPRLRGSSVLACPTPPSDVICHHASTSDQVETTSSCRNATLSATSFSSPSSSIRTQDVKLKTTIDSSVALSGTSTPTSPHFHVSVALSAVPEVTEEQSTTGDVYKLGAAFV